MSHLNNHFLNSLALTGAVCLASSLPGYSQALDATDGIIFGPGNPGDPGVTHPTIAKGSSDQDLEFDFFANGKMQIFRDGYESGGDPLPVFQVGEGYTGTIVSSKINRWYRIAETLPSGQGISKRANAQFSLRDDISGGGHSTAVFRAGISFGDGARSGLTLLSHTGFNTTTFPNVRIVEGETYDQAFLEVYVRRAGDVRFSITDNLGNGGWIPLDWQESPGVPSGYQARQYNIDKSFVVGDYKSRFSVARGGRVDIDGPLYIKGVPVSDDRYDGRYIRKSGNISLSADVYGGVLEIGNNNDIRESWSSSILGNDNRVLNSSVQLQGYGSFASNVRSSISVGDGNDLGRASTSDGGHNMALFGKGLINATSDSTIVGRYNEFTGVESNVLFAVGNGIGDAPEERSNALEVYSDGSNGGVNVYGDLKVNGASILSQDDADDRYIPAGGVANFSELYVNNDFSVGAAANGGGSSLILGNDNSETGSWRLSLMGSSNTAESSYNTQVIGSYSSIAKTADSFSVGANNVLGNEAASSHLKNMVVMGKGLINETSNSTRVGQYNEYTGHESGVLFTVGNGTSDANRSNAFEVNQSGVVSAKKAFVMGLNNSTDRAQSSMVLGTGNELDLAYHSLAIGSNNQMGDNENTFPAVSSVAIGHGLKNFGTNSLVIGQNNDPDSYATFSVGNGMSDTERSNAFEVHANGTVIMSKAQGDVSMGIFGD